MYEHLMVPFPSLAFPSLPFPSPPFRYAVDPVLNRGVALESLKRYEEATSDYKAVLEASPNDPAAWNNLGNVQVREREGGMSCSGRYSWIKTREVTVGWAMRSP